MAFFGASDLPAMLADFGVPIAWAAVSGLGIVDVADEESMGAQAGSFSGKERVVRLETERFAGLGEGETLTVDSVDYYVISVHQEGDGALTRVLCRPL